MSRRGYGDGESYSLFVRGLSIDTRPESIKEAFVEYGEIKDVYLPRDFYTKLPRGFAYVEFATKKDADAALDGMHGHKIDDRVVAVEYARGNRKSRGEMKDRDRRYSPSYSRSRSRSDSRGPSRYRRGRGRSYSRSPGRRSYNRSSRRSYGSRSPPPYSRGGRRGRSRDRSRSRSPPRGRTRYRSESPPRGRTRYRSESPARHGGSGPGRDRSVSPRD